MKSITRRVAAAAGALAMAGGIMGAVAAPASASGADTEAYAAQSDGPFGFLPPVGFASSPGTGFAPLTGVPLFHFVGLAGVTDRAYPDFASSTILTLGVKVPHDGSAVLWGYNVEASCSIDNNGDASGTTTL